MQWLKLGVAVDLPLGVFVDSVDGFTAKTALSITQPDIRLKKNGANWAQKSAAQTLAHEENGWYEVSLSTTDTNTLGLLMLAVTKAGALPVWREFMVLPAAVYDALVSDTVTIPAQVAPPATPGFIEAVAYLYKAWRHPKDQTATTYKLYNDAGTTVEQKATVSDNGTTFSQTKVISGP